MLPTFDEFQQRADAVRAQIADACHQAGRDPSEVALLAVTKTHPVAAAEYAFRYGLKAVGENRVQEAVEKKPRGPADLRWELIGHLQSNKAKVAADVFDRVQSVDSEKLLTLLDRASADRGKTLSILLQVNAGHDPAKFGADLGDAPKLLEAALQKPNLRVDGLMAIAPLSDDPAVARRTFSNLRILRDRLASEFHVGLPELSMGMSGDLAIAIAEGSTQVRVGTALFGNRAKVAG